MDVVQKEKHKNEVPSEIYLPEETYGFYSIPDCEPGLVEFFADGNRRSRVNGNGVVHPVVFKQVAASPRNICIFQSNLVQPRTRTLGRLNPRIFEMPARLLKFITIRILFLRRAPVLRHVPSNVVLRGAPGMILILEKVHREHVAAPRRE